MKKILGAALAAGATVSAAGAAEAQVSASVTLTSDYVFLGISLSSEDPEMQGSFDYATDSFYVGVWGTSLASNSPASVELDVYAGLTPTLGPVAFDLGVVGYF